MVSDGSDSIVSVFPVKVFTKICILKSSVTTSLAMASIEDDLFLLESQFTRLYHKDDLNEYLGYAYHIYISWIQTGEWIIDWGRRPFSDVEKSRHVFKILSKNNIGFLSNGRVYSVHETAREALIICNKIVRFVEKNAKSCNTDKLNPPTTRQHT